MFAAPANWTQLPASLAPTIALLECAGLYRRFRSQISAHRSLWLRVGDALTSKGVTHTR